MAYLSDHFEKNLDRLKNIYSKPENEPIKKKEFKVGDVVYCEYCEDIRRIERIRRDKYGTTYQLKSITGNADCAPSKSEIRHATPEDMKRFGFERVPDYEFIPTEKRYRLKDGTDWRKKEEKKKTFSYEWAGEIKKVELNIKKEEMEMKDEWEVVDQYEREGRDCRLNDKVHDGRIRITVERKVDIHKKRREATLSLQYIKENACGDWGKNAHDELYCGRDKVTVVEAIGWIYGKSSRETAIKWLAVREIVTWHTDGCVIPTGISK